jgi:large subunit ribosomal protein L18e
LEGFIGSHRSSNRSLERSRIMKQRRPTNPELLSAIGYLMKAGRQYQTPLWISVASFLGKSRRTRIVLNLGQVSRHVKDGDVIAVPGKVLGSGIPREKLTIAAFKFSPRALVKVEKAGGRCIPFSRLVEENPQGTNVRLLR